MATTTALLTLTSTDLLTDELSLSASATLTNAGGSTGVTQCSGLSRKTVTYASSGVIDTSVIYRADDYTTDGANKVYIKNMSTTAAEYFTVYITGDRATDVHGNADPGLTELGRLYAGDWAFFPWNASGGAREVFTVTIANTWASGDTFVFDGVTVVAADSTLNNIAAQIDAAQYPNWVTSVSGAVVTFQARYSNAGIEIDTSEAVSTTAGDGTGAVATTIEGTRSTSDIYIKPSVHTGMTYETLLIHE
jgi:hypothetical protein